MSSWPRSSSATLSRSFPSLSMRFDTLTRLSRRTSSTTLVMDRSRSSCLPMVMCAASTSLCTATRCFCRPLSAASTFSPSCLAKKLCSRSRVSASPLLAAEEAPGDHIDEACGEPEPDPDSRLAMAVPCACTPASACSALVPMRATATSMSR